MSTLPLRPTFPLLRTLLLLAVLSMSSCNWWSQQSRHATAQHQYDRHSLLDSGEWRLHRSTGSWEWTNAKHRILIFPTTSPIRIHPDSGFIGEVSLVLLTRQHSEITHQTESLTFAHSHTQKADSLTATSTIEQSQYREVDGGLSGKISWWSWLLLAGAVVLLLFVILRRMFAS